MRISWGFAFVLVALLACGEKDSEPAPVYTSPDGIWVFTTSENAIHVEFELKTSPSGVLEILNSKIEVAGTPGKAAGHLTNVDLPFIEKIKINANDAGLVVDYAITFSNCNVSSTFNAISVTDGNYTYPWGQLRTFSGVTITRK